MSELVFRFEVLFDHHQRSANKNCPQGSLMTPSPASDDSCMWPLANITAGKMAELLQESVCNFHH